MYLYPIVRVEHCSTLDTCIHLYPLVSLGVNANWIQVDTCRPYYGRSNHSQQLIVIIRGHPAKNYDKYWGRYFEVSSKVQHASHVVVASATNHEPSTTAAVVVFFAQPTLPRLMIQHKLNRRHHRSPFCDQAANDVAYGHSLYL